MGRTAGRSGLERSVSATREKNLTIEGNSHRRVDVGKFLATNTAMSDKLERNRKLLNEVILGSSSPGPLVAAMARLWDFGRLLVGSSFESLRRRLEAANAFQNDDSAILRF